VYRLARIFTLKSSQPGVRIRDAMNDEPPKDLATRAFQKRVLDEFAAVRAEQSAIRSEISEIRAGQSALHNDITEMRNDIVQIRTQQVALAESTGALDYRFTALEERIDARLKETRLIWEAVQEQLQRLVERFDAALVDFYELRSEMKIHGRRIAELERRVLG
jgi:predicted  nucleic acid-binding Zn-ribbon protein